MAKKDLNLNENIDRDKRMSEDPDIPEPEKKYDDEAKGIAEVNVKNAHASGDGSTGRNDKRLVGAEDSGDPEID